MMKMRSVLAVAALALAPAMAFGQWSDNFDAYSVGSINGQGGWKGWDNTPAAAGLVTNNMFRSGPNSQQIDGPADSIHEFSGVTAGQWSFTAWQFIPTGFTGETYFILQNVYNDLGPYAWAVQLSFDSTTGLVTDDNGRPENTISYVTGAWTEIRVDFDLDANTISEYYNGALLATGEWTTPTGVRALGAVDLFANNATPVWYDDMALTQIPAPGAGAVLAMAGLLGVRRRR